MVKSALVNTPPVTDDDFWIVRSLLLAAGVKNPDPARGTRIPPFGPPPGQPSGSRAGSIITGCAVAIVIMTLFTGTRLLLRLFKRGLRWGADDWFIIPGTLLAISWPAIQIAYVQYGGGGKHIYDVTYYNLYMSNWLGSVAKLVFFCAVGIIKMSIVMFNMRLTGLTSPKWLIAHWTFFALLVGYTLAAFFMNVFQCNPPRANFDSIYAGKLNGPPKCITENELGVSLSSMHVAMDFCLLTVPLILLWKIHASKITKFRFLVVFAVGAMSSIGSVVRQVAQAQLKSDPTWNYVNLVQWTLIDLTAGIMAVNLPTLNVILPGRWRILRDKNNSNSRSTNHKPSPTDTSTTQSSNLDQYQEPVPRVSNHESQDGILRNVDIELQYHESDANAFQDHAVPHALSYYPPTVSETHH